MYAYTYERFYKYHFRPSIQHRRRSPVASAVAARLLLLGPQFDSPRRLAAAAARSLLDRFIILLTILLIQYMTFALFLFMFLTLFYMAFALFLFMFLINILIFLSPLAYIYADARQSG